MNLRSLAPWCLAAFTTIAGGGHAAVVVAPVAALATTSNGPHVAARTIDQSGLSAGYLPGSTDWDTYFATGPGHAAAGVNGWLSLPGDNTPVLRLDLGEIRWIDALALWNSDAFPPAFFDLWSSIDGVIYGNVLDDVATVAQGLGVDTLPELHEFGGAVAARYFELRLVCRPNDGACAIGEVAFRSDAAAVPLPPTAALLLAPLLGWVATRRRLAWRP